MDNSDNVKLVKIAHALNVAASVPDPKDPQVQEYLKDVIHADISPGASQDNLTTSDPNPDKNG